MTRSVARQYLARLLLAVAFLWPALPSLAQTDRVRALDPGPVNCSSVLLGSVAVSVICHESDGSIEPSQADWAPAGMAAEMKDVRDALDWIAKQTPPEARLEFRLDSQFSPRLVTTGYEPLSGGRGFHQAIFAKLGYDTSRDDGHNQFVRDVRQRMGTDWAIVIILYAGSSTAASSGYHGPDVVAAQNASPLTFVHEILHCFGATHCYLSPDASERSPSDTDGPAGFLGIPATSLDGSKPYCVMWECRPAICWDPVTRRGTRGQLGWIDSDSDGVLDPVDTVPEVIGTLDGRGILQDGRRHALTGWHVVLWQRLTGAVYRVPGQPPQAAKALDGAFDSAHEEFRCQAPPGSVVEVLADNNVGNRTDGAMLLVPYWVRQPHRRWVDNLSFSPDGAGLVSSGQEPSTAFIDAATGRLGQPLADGTHCAAYSPDGRWLALGGHRRAVVQSTRGGGTVAELTDPRDWVLSLSWSPDGRLLAAAGGERAVYLWRTADRHLVWRRPVDQEIWWLRFQPDGQSLLAEGLNGSGGALDLRDGTERQSYADAFAPTVSPDGSLLATCTTTRVRLTDTATGKVTAWPQFSRRPRASAFAPDGAWLATGDEEGLIRLRRLRDGAVLAQVTCGEPVTRLCFSPDERRLAAGTNSGRVILLPTGLDG